MQGHGRREPNGTGSPGRGLLITLLWVLMLLASALPATQLAGPRQVVAQDDEPAASEPAPVLAGEPADQPEPTATATALPTNTPEPTATATATATCHETHRADEHTRANGHRDRRADEHAGANGDGFADQYGRGHRHDCPAGNLDDPTRADCSANRHAGGDRDALGNGDPFPLSNRLPAGSRRPRGCVLVAIVRK